MLKLTSKNRYAENVQFLETIGTTILIVCYLLSDGFINSEDLEIITLLSKQTSIEEKTSKYAISFLW